MDRIESAAGLGPCRTVPTPRRASSATLLPATISSTEVTQRRCSHYAVLNIHSFQLFRVSPKLAEKQKAAKELLEKKRALLVDKNICPKQAERLKLHPGQKLKGHLKRGDMPTDDGRTPGLVHQGQRQGARCPRME